MIFKRKNSTLNGGIKMTVFEIFAYGAGFATAATKLITTAKPYWDKLPAVVSAVIPSLIVLLPAVAERLGALQTEADLKTLGLTVVALLLPGVVTKPKADAEIK